nr:hypothetical protein [Tanacetum cinerariifolium]
IKQILRNPTLLLLRELSELSTNMDIKTTAGGIYGEVGLNTFRNAIGAHYLPHSSEYVAPPYIDVVRKWFPTIGYGEKVSTKGTLRKSLFPPSIDNGIHIDYANIFWEDIILKLKKKQKEKALKPNQPEEHLFIDHLLAICALDKPVVFKSLKTSSRAESVSQGAKLGAKTGHKKPATSSKQPSVSRKEATKGRSSKAPTGSKTGYSKKRKKSSSANLPSVSTPVDTKMHKEDQQAIGHDVSAYFIPEADRGLSAPNDSIPPQQGMDEGTKKTSYDLISTGTDLHVLADQTKSVSEGLEIVLTQPITEKGASFTSIHGDKEVASTAIHGDKEKASSTINLEDLAKLVSQIQPSFKDPDSPEDDPVIIVDESDKDEQNAKTKGTSVPRSSSLRGFRVYLYKSQISKCPFKRTGLPEEFLSLPVKVESGQAKLKTLDALPSLSLNVIKALNKFTEVLESTSTKARYQSIPSKGQADIMTAEGEKDTNQATISHLFQRRADKIVEAKKENLNQQPK